MRTPAGRWAVAQGCAARFWAIACERPPPTDLAGLVALHDAARAYRADLRTMADRERVPGVWARLLAELDDREAALWAGVPRGGQKDVAMVETERVTA